MSGNNILKGQALKARIDGERKKIMTGWIIAAAGLITAVFGFLMTMSSDSGVYLFVDILGIILLFAGLIYRKKAKTRIKDLISENIMPQILDEFFDDWEYNPKERLPDTIVRTVDLEIPHYVKVKGSDYIKAAYKGINLEMSDIEFIDEETEVRSNSKGETYVETRDVTVFKGMWVVCDFNKQLSADLLLREKRKGENVVGKVIKGKNTVETESEAFNKKYVIRTADPHTAFYVLTPHMMEYILSMDEKAGGQTHMRFCGSKLHLAVNSGRDAFEIKGRDVKNIDKIKENFTADLKYVTDLIDELRLCKSIYKK
ncbi:MAG: DUF3137 domain-containing protein [Clostridiales bacterium]|nr:DUF3137 domain-containing protein [Clostridiales bacterium]